MSRRLGDSIQQTREEKLQAEAYPEIAGQANKMDIVDLVGRLFQTQEFRDSAARDRLDARYGNGFVEGQLARHPGLTAGKLEEMVNAFGF